MVFSNMDVMNYKKLILALKKSTYLYGTPYSTYLIAWRIFEEGGIIDAALMDFQSYTYISVMDFSFLKDSNYI